MAASGVEAAFRILEGRWLIFFFNHTPTSRAKGVELLTRAWQRTEDSIRHR